MTKLFGVALRWERQKTGRRGEDEEKKLFLCSPFHIWNHWGKCRCHSCDIVQKHTSIFLQMSEYEKLLTIDACYDGLYFVRQLHRLNLHLIHMRPLFLRHRVNLHAQCQVLLSLDVQTSVEWDEGGKKREKNVLAIKQTVWMKIFSIKYRNLCFRIFSFLYFSLPLSGSIISRLMGQGILIHGMHEISFQLAMDEQKCREIESIWTRWQ